MHQQDHASCIACALVGFCSVEVLTLLWCNGLQICFQPNVVWSLRFKPRKLQNGAHAHLHPTACIMMLVNDSVSGVCQNECPHVSASVLLRLQLCSSSTKQQTFVEFKSASSFD